MNEYKTFRLIGIAALGWICLIFFQAKWMGESHRLIEEQFDQKVTMALCAAVNSLDSTDHLACGFPINETQQFSQQFGLPDSNIKTSTEKPYQFSENELRKSLDEAMVFYDIHLPYQIKMHQEEIPSCDPSSPYCCTINPFDAHEDQAQISIIFPGKQKYIFKKMWAMIASSIFILIFVLVIFLWTLRALIRQRRISQFNIDFFNNMAHEFNTPVTNIQLALKRLISKNPHLAKDAYVQIIKKEDQKLAEQVKGVLSLAKIDNEDCVINKEPIQLYGLLHEVVHDMKLQIQEFGATITIDEKINGTIVNGDKFHLAHVFKNLIENALKYCQNKPELKIYGHSESGHFTLTFEDNGIGISKSDRQIIFNKFQRVGNEIMHDQKGFGLGLSYAKMILKHHKGKIEVKSKQDKGSKFELSLPLT